MGTQGPAQFCESCGTSLHEGAKFCPSCGTSVGAAPEPARQTTTPVPPPPPPGYTPPASPPPSAPAPPPGSPPPGVAPAGSGRNWTPWLIGLGVVVVIGIAVGVVLLLSGGGGKSGPTKAQIAARQAAAAHQQELDEAANAQTTLSQAWSAEVTTDNGNTNQEKTAAQNGDLNTARGDFASDANAIQQLLNTLNTLNVPPSVQADLHTLITAANTTYGADQSAALPSSDFNTAVNAVNQSLTALDSAHDVVVNDLSNITSS